MIEFKASPDGEIRGYASCWGGPADAVNDVVQPGAFRASLAAGRPRMLREHRGQPIGDWLEAEEDDIGLRVRGQVTDPATLADLRAGRLGGLSIGFVATKAHRDGAGRRTLAEVDLEEISIVRRPASGRARVLSVKSKPDPKGTTMADQTNPPPDPDAEEDANTETRLAAVETAVAGIDKRLAAVEEATKTTAKGVKSIETALRRPGAATVETKAAPEAETVAFTRFLRAGLERLDAAEVKSLRIADDTGGGYLVPVEIQAEILKGITLISPVRQVANVRQTSAAQVVLPRRTGTPIATWTGETEDHVATQSSYGAAEFNVSEMTAFTDISNAMLEDAAFDVAAEISSDLAEQFGKAEGTAFVNGNGIKKPFGFLQDPNIQTVKSGSNTAVSADSLYDLFHSLPSFYSGNAAWAMNRTTLGAIRKLKDANGRYLLSFDGMPNNPSATILGRPVVEMADMPDVAGGTTPIIFADFKNLYRIFDRLSLNILRDPYSMQTKGLIRFHARRRVAGAVGKAEAGRKLLIAA